METPNLQDFMTKCEAAFEEKMGPVKERLKSDDTFATESAKQAMERMVDDLVKEFVGDFHKSLKLNLQDVLSSQGEDSTSGEDEEVGYEEEPLKKTEEIKCPKCKRPINASRFAPHLEKCMKMGRSSSRIARTRIAKNTSETSFHGAAISDDDEADEDWNLEKSANPTKRPQETKKKKGKQSQSRRNKLPKLAREDIFEQKDKTPYTKFMVMSVDEKMNFLSSNCGVRIEGSGNICTKSLRCNQHSEEDRAVIRKTSLEPPSNQENFVDIEGLAEQKSEPDRSCTPSPAGTPTPTPPNSASKRKKSKQKAKDWGQDG